MASRKFLLNLKNSPVIARNLTTQTSTLCSSSSGTSKKTELGEVTHTGQTEMASFLSESSSEDSQSPEEKLRRKNVCQYIATLYKSNDATADVKLIVGDQEAKVHALVLSSHSDVFSKMLSEGFMEGTKREITITDFKFEVVEQMVEYVYKGTITNIENSPSELLKIAEKYNIGPLKSKCEKVMERNLSVANALKTLVFADANNAERLELATLLFIKANFKKVRFTNEWTQFREDHRLLLEKITDTLGGLTPKKRKCE